MERSPDTIFPFNPPSEEESAALALSARYLLRAGTQAATRLLACEPPDARAELLACLCDGLTCSPAEALHSAELGRWARRLS